MSSGRQTFKVTGVHRTGKPTATNSIYVMDLEAVN
jgi:hypothetical protein